VGREREQQGTLTLGISCCLNEILLLGSKLSVFALQGATARCGKADTQHTDGGRITHAVAVRIKFWLQYHRACGRMRPKGNETGFALFLFKRNSKTA